MNLYLISQDERCGYDTYDSAVVAAVDETSAKMIQPGYTKEELVTLNKVDPWKDNAWCSGPEHVLVELIGEARPGTEEGTICASFNAS